MEKLIVNSHPETAWPIVLRSGQEGESNGSERSWITEHGRTAPLCHPAASVPVPAAWTSWNCRSECAGNRARHCSHQRRRRRKM